MAILTKRSDFRLIESVFWERKIAKMISAYFADSANIARIVSLDCSDGRAESSIDLGSGIRAIEQSYTLQNSGIFRRTGNLWIFNLSPKEARL